MDFSNPSASHPILSCSDSQKHEAKLLDTDGKIWAAMESVGQFLSQEILKEYRFTRYRIDKLSLFALIGKGHNGGDALLAMAELAELGIVDHVTLVLATSEENLRPNTKRALDQLRKRIDGDQLIVLTLGYPNLESSLVEIENGLDSKPHDICLDGLLGMQFRAPLKEPFARLIELTNRSKRFRLRVAVDLPSGLGEPSDSIIFKADVTVATGILKSPLLSRRNEETIGSIRYLDLDFFDEAFASSERVLTEHVLDPMRGRRAIHVNKRSFGHLVIVAGSRKMPGALAMSVRAALKSGVGLVTVCAPESVVAQLSVSIPEAMWIPWPETPQGGLALEGISMYREIQARATCILIGPGLGRERETSTMVIELLKHWTGSLVLDADALTFDIMNWVQGHCIVTPHLGEFRRIANLDGAIADIDGVSRKFARERDVVVVQKGPNTRVATRDCLYLNTSGNSVLARGGSGDVLAGLTAGILATMPDRVVEAACMSTFWHGKAADLLAEDKGQVAVQTTELIDYLADALLEKGRDNIETKRRVLDT